MRIAQLSSWARNIQLRYVSTAYQHVYYRCIQALRFILVHLDLWFQTPSAESLQDVINHVIHVYGIGTEWPTELSSEAFEAWIEQTYDASTPGIQRIIRLHKQTGIEKRHAIAPTHPMWRDKKAPPDVEQIDTIFRQHATQLAVSACIKAMIEWGGEVKDITHTVAVTCTNSGSPGYDLQIATQLGLSLRVERTLLHGVGCAGGLSALRTAAQLVRASGGRPANVLVFACEIPSIHVFPELIDAELQSDTSIGPVLFSDGAAALVVSNTPVYARPDKQPIYRLLDSLTARVPNTESLMSYHNTRLGFKLSLSRQVPVEAVRSILPTFSHMRRVMCERSSLQGHKWLGQLLTPLDFDWALHPGGLSIIKGAEMALGITHDHLRASYDVYRTRGNSSSVAVLAVLDRLRRIESGRDSVMAVSFGPGLTVEMTALERCRSVSRLGHQGKDASLLDQEVAQI